MTSPNSMSPASNSTPSSSSTRTILFTLSLILLALGWSGYVFFWPEYQNAQLIKHGVAAQGIILEVHPTGNLYNDQPQVRVKIRITPLSGEPFEAETKMIINPVYLPQFQPGAIVRAKFDPANHARVAVE